MSGGIAIGADRGVREPDLADGPDTLDFVGDTVAGRKITIDLTPAARHWLAVKGFDRAFGARPMARLIEKSIKKPLSELLLFGGLADGGRVVVDLHEDTLQVTPAGLPGFAPQ
mgnify:CR=1 FL=1